MWCFVPCSSGFAQLPRRSKQRKFTACAFSRRRQESATATYDSVSSAYSEDGTVPQDGLRVVIEEAKKNAKISREIPINQVADLSMLKGAQTEIGKEK
jgi:hypothetical protein